MPSTRSKNAYVLRCVVLQHDAPPECGGTHADLLIEMRPALGPDDKCLAAWRLPLSVIAPISLSNSKVLRLKAERLGNHRALYLEHEGKLSRGRGQVRRVLTGWGRQDHNQNHDIFQWTLNVPGVLAGTWAGWNVGGTPGKILSRYEFQLVSARLGAIMEHGIDASAPP